MSVSEQLARIQADKSKLKNKAVELGIADSTANLDALATAFEGVENRGAVSAQVQEGDTYTIPKGYHNGSGTVSGVSGGGNYQLQSKSATPTKAQQNVTPDSGYYGLSDVTIGAIPAAYQDVTGVTAAAADVLTGKVIVAADGSTVAGAMINNGAVTKTLTAAAPTYTVPAGYHSGTGTVTITPQSKTATPTKSPQSISPDSGKVLSGVTVEAIPETYQDVTGVTAVAADVLEGKVIVNASGESVEGSMNNNGEINATIDGLTVTSYSVPAGYTAGGTVSLTDDIEQALAAI